MALNILKAILPERLPTQTRLLANYPNPFNPETWIPFELSQDTKVIITIYDVQGNSVCQLELGMVMAGKYVTADQAAYWDGKGETGETVASGQWHLTFISGKPATILKPARGGYGNRGNPNQNVDLLFWFR